MTIPLTILDLHDERDLVLARQRARVVADRFGFESQDQIRIASAVSEVGRLAIRPGGIVRLAFLMNERPDSGLAIEFVAPRLDRDARWERGGPA